MNACAALSLLAAGEDGISEWNLKQENRERLPSLAETCLRDIPLQNVNFDGRDLRGANFGCQALRFGAAIDRCSFVGARLDYASFNGRKILNTSFRKAVLLGCAMQCAEIIGNDFCEANLTGAYWIGSVIAKCELRGANVERLQIQGSTLRALDFSECNGSFPQIILSELDGVRGTFCDF